MDEARNLYDQLLPMGPILLALTAATPVAKGFLAETDVRWNIYAASTDDRTREECGEKVCFRVQFLSISLLMTACCSHSARIDGDYQSRDAHQVPHLHRRTHGCEMSIWIRL